MKKLLRNIEVWISQQLEDYWFNICLYDSGKGDFSYFPVGTNNYISKTLICGKSLQFIYIQYWNRVKSISLAKLAN